MEFIRITFTGDILCTIPELLASAKGEDCFDFSPIFSRINQDINGSDFVIGNLETPIAGREVNYTNVPTLFNSPIDFAKAVKEAGIDLVTTANNHALDKGVFGLRQTLKNLDGIALEHTGTRMNPSEKPYVIKNINGIKFAFLSYTYGSDSQWRNNGLLPDDDYSLNLFREQDSFPVNSHSSRVRDFLKNVIPEIIKKQLRDSTYPDCGRMSDLTSPHLSNMEEVIRQAKAEADYVIMCLHIGGQFNSKVGEYTNAVIEKCISSGCDSVICNHPHCVLNAKKIDNGIIAYALGNFTYTPHWGYFIEGVYADYSILLNLLFEKVSKKYTGCSYSVIKNVKEGTHTVVENVADIYEKATLKEKKKLEKDVKNVIKRFTKSDTSNINVEREYNL